MLSDSSFRRTAKCNYYKNLLATKQIPEFPIQRVSPAFLDTNELIHSTGFNKPFVITPCATDANPENANDSSRGQDTTIGIVLPSRDKDLTYVSDVVGAATPVKIIEVGQQAEITDWTLGEYANYLKNYRAEDHKILNMITLEFSNTPLNSKVQAPAFVRDLDWIDTIWPIERRARGDYPKVQKYCLAGMAGSYTDFHIDFGGTSVWYHVLNGRKRFYLVPPTTANLRAFEKWTTSSAQADEFFGDLLEPSQCFQFDLYPGETFMIPSGWIHAVFTPVDSLVFGGNFVHAYAMLRQLQIYSIEHRTRVQKAYRFPFFRQINWYFLCTVLPVAKEMYCAEKSASSWVDDMMSDDEQDDLEVICETLKDPVVLLQLPYLVRTCEIWRNSGADGQEKGVFDVSIKDTGCASVEEIFAEWWKLLLVIATKLPDCASDKCATTAAEASSHISHIQSMETLDLLDDEVVRPVFQAFERDLRAQLAAVAPDLPPLPPAASSSGSADGVAVSGGAVPPQEPLKLKLSFKKATPVPAQADVSTVAPVAAAGLATSATVNAAAAAVPSTAPAVAPQSENRAPETKRKISLIATPVTVEESPVPEAAETAADNRPTKRFKLTFGAKQAPAPKVNGNTVAAQRATNYDHSSTDDSSKRYGTRGLKLSADFLSRAMDVDVGDEASEPEGDVEEEYVEAPAWRTGRSGAEEDALDGEDRRSASGRNTCKRSARGENTVFLDHEEGDEWRHKGGSNRTGGSESGEEDSDHMLDSDAEEDFTDDDGFIVNDSDRKNKKRNSATAGKGASAGVGKTVSKAQKGLPAPKPQYFVDRLSEPSARNTGPAYASMVQQQKQQQGVGGVPQVQGVRSQLLNSSSAARKPSSAAPANNRLKIMKKLGLKL